MKCDKLLLWGMTYLLIVSLGCIGFAQSRSSRKEYARLLFLFPITPDRGGNQIRPRYDAMARSLNEFRGSKCYIIGYAGREAKTCEAFGYAEYYKKELHKFGQIELTRIVVIDGGFREKPSVEFYLVPEGADPPKPRLTLNIRNVRITPAPDWCHKAKN